MTFKTRLKIRIIYCLASSAFGIFLLLFAVAYLSGNTMSTVLSLGSGIAGASIVMTINMISYFTNEGKCKKAELKANDERNQFIMGKTSRITCGVTLICLFVAYVVFKILMNDAVSYTLLSVIWFVVLVLFLTKFIISKIY